MTITYTAPIAQVSITVKRLRHFAADPTEHRIVTDYDVGYLDGSGVFIVLSTQRRLFTDSTTPSFADFVVACPAAANLRRQAEQYEVTLDAPGTVD